MSATALSPTRAPWPLAARWLLRLAVFASAVILALVISGAIFRIIPGVMVAHARGISMEPAYRDGDVVIIRLTRPEQVHIGEVVLFQVDGVPVTHRVIQVGPEAGANTVILTKGDNNAVADKAIKLSGVRGKVVGKLPLLGQTSRWLGAGGGFYVYHYAALILNLVFVLAFASVSVARLNARSKHPANS